MLIVFDFIDDTWLSISMDCAWGFCAFGILGED